VENLKAKVTKLTEQLVEAQNNEAKAEARLQRRTGVNLINILHATVLYESIFAALL